MQSKDHWEQVYTAKPTSGVSWFQELAVADLVLCALEELARKDTNCQGTLDRAYLQSVAVGTIVDVPTSSSR